MKKKVISFSKIKKDFLSLLDSLSSREKDVLILHYGLSDDLIKKEKPKMSLQEIGNYYQISRERVRQIESGAIKKIQKNSLFTKELVEIKEIIFSLLKKLGGIAEREFFLNKLLEKFGIKDEREAKLAKNFFIFIINKFLNDSIEEFQKDKEFERGWRFKDASLTFVRKAIRELVRIVEKEGEPISESDLIKKFKQTGFYLNNKKKLTDLFILSLLHLTNRMGKNLFNEWGFSFWGLVQLRKISDKIYYVLKKEKRPLHFTEIVQLINKHYSLQSAHEATVRNNLTADIRYVLVGRGIYALAEWGVEPGTVSELIEKILKRAQKPLPKEEIINEVLKQRLVKKQTILVALGNKEKFEKLPGGKYRLKKI